MWHDAFIRVTWLIHMCDMTHSDVWHDSSRCVTWLIQMCDMTHSYVTWLIRMSHMTHFIRDMTHIYVTWLIHMWHDSFIFDMTHSYTNCLIPMWHDLFICDMTQSHVTCQVIVTFVMSHVWHMNESVDDPLYIISIIYKVTHDSLHMNIICISYAMRHPCYIHDSWMCAEASIDSVQYILYL